MFDVSIVTPESIYLEEKVYSVIAPGLIGYLQILVNHAPLITALHAGRLTIVDKDKNERLYAIAGGFLEVLDNKVIILADAIEPSTGIDVPRAKSALTRAERRICRHSGDIDLFRARSAFDRARNRMKLAPRASLPPRAPKPRS
ncbi:MAG: ATP synthase F1 subunit epsilon [Chlamydiales bacterium]|nr:ATP synthase F1 subunit epsilon [Chlamydiales bacterium]